MIFRLLTVLCIVLLVSAGLAVAMFATLAPGGWTAAKIVMAVSCLAAAPWVGFCAANGLIGFFLRLARPEIPPPHPARFLTEAPAPAESPPIAIALTVRNEAIEQVLRPARVLLNELDAAATGHTFVLFVLSDSDTSTDQEERAVAAFRAWDPHPDRIRYRRRSENHGFKAGNIMEFLRHHADGFELMLVLDADSVMSADAVLRLVSAMREDPSLGIVQHLTVGLPASSAFPRLFQFGMRAGMRTWATALAWWQGDECVYWGHNALIRIAPFREHCQLPLLPDGTHILSHDQVEAAMLRGAGWGVRLLPEEDGSYEANPPALPEFMRRELRWLAGNLEYRHLLRMPGLRPMGRWQLLQAILLFASPPFYLAFLCAAAWAAATDTVSRFPFGPALAASLIWTGALYAPKLTGYLEILLSGKRRALYGGVGRALAGMALEIVFTLLLDAINMLAKTIAIVRIALGLRAGWTPQNRTDRGISWSEAARLLWPQTLLGLAAFLAFAQAGWTAVLWAAPLAGGLVLAIPFCVVTAASSTGAWLRLRQWAAIPEEARVTEYSRAADRVG